MARVGGLLAVALVPAVAGLGGINPGDARFHAGVARALQISAFLAVGGALSSFAFVRKASPIRPVTQPSVSHACQDPCLREPVGTGASRSAAS